MIDPAKRLCELDEAGLLRKLRRIDGAQGPKVDLDGHEVLLLCSNNYLGLAGHPVVREAAAAACLELGTGSGASRLISGNMDIHERLESELAEFHGFDSTLLFGSGYLANTGVIPALVGEGDVVFSDALNHASIVDGCRLSGARKFIYKHADLDHLELGLRQAGERAALIVTDGVFSMDGDIAPLPELIELAQRYDCRLMVDDAHAVGAVGPGGAGTVAAAGGEGVDVLTGTLGKSLGSYGAYACLSADLRHLLINTARPFIFSTAPPPASAAAALAALGLIRDRPQRRRTLGDNSVLLRDALAAEGLSTKPSRSQIMPVMVGEAETAMLACELALEAGVFAQAIRPPTVPDGTSRLRLSVMANHDSGDLARAATVIGEAVREARSRSETLISGGAAQPSAPPADSPAQLRVAGTRSSNAAATPTRRAA